MGYIYWGIMDRKSEENYAVNHRELYAKLNNRHLTKHSYEIQH